jgi:hypothetical protein
LAKELGRPLPIEQSKPNTLANSQNSNEEANQKKKTISLQKNDKNSKEIKPLISQEEIERQFEELKEKLNNEMVAILDEEQDNENKRDEELIQATTEEEKIRLERKFGIERAKAQKRIQDLSRFL